MDRIPEFLDKISADLDRTIEFWLRYSHDQVYGGFFDCLGCDGQVYDDLKHIWLQARQVWMYCRLYNDVERFRKPTILEAAIKGAEFLMKYAKDPVTYKCHLVVTRDGKPVKIQKTLFSECFYLMAMSEVGRATGQQLYKNEALKMMEKIQNWVKTHGDGLGIVRLDGMAPYSMLAIPMMILCVIQQLHTMDSNCNYPEFAEWAIKDALKHIQRDGNCILENTTPDAKELPGSNGRLMNPDNMTGRQLFVDLGPQCSTLLIKKRRLLLQTRCNTQSILEGHAIEAGWFLLQHAIKINNEDLKQKALNNFMINPFSYGWDDKHGGIFYFLDADGLSPTQLEWDMKLWWPHNEAMISFLMAYKETREQKYLDMFEKVFDYSYSHFVDEVNGEWYGYLNRRGEVTHSFKGGPWKGFINFANFVFSINKRDTEYRRIVIPF